MFGNLFGDLEQKQADLQKKLTTIIVSGSAGGGAVTVEASADGRLTNVAIDKSALSSDDPEELEDLLLTAANDALEAAAARQAEETQALMSQILPPGMEGMLPGL